MHDTVDGSEFLHQLENQNPPFVSRVRYYIYVYI